MTLPLASAEPTDATLIAQWRSGDDGAMTLLVQRHAGLVHEACRRQLGDGEADDAAQAVFLILARRVTQAARAPVLPAWLLAVTRRVCANAQRVRRRRSAAEGAARRAWQEAPVDAAPVLPAEAAMEERLRPALDAAIAALPEVERAAIVGHYLAGQSQADLARACGCPDATMRARVHRGIQRLRQRLRPQGELRELGLITLLLQERERAARAQASAAAHLTMRPPTARALAWAHRVRWETLMFYAAPIAAVTLAGCLCVAGPLASATTPTAPVPPPVPPGEEPLRHAAIAQYRALRADDVDAFIAALAPQSRHDVLQLLAWWRSGALHPGSNSALSAMLTFVHGPQPAHQLEQLLAPVLPTATAQLHQALVSFRTQGLDEAIAELTGTGCFLSLDAHLDATSTAVAARQLLADLSAWAATAGWERTDRAAAACDALVRAAQALGVPDEHALQALPAPAFARRVGRSWHALKGVVAPYGIDVDRFLDSIRAEQVDADATPAAGRGEPHARVILGFDAFGHHYRMGPARMVLEDGAWVAEAPPPTSAGAPAAPATPVPSAPPPRMAAAPPAADACPSGMDLSLGPTGLFIHLARVMPHGGG